MAIDLATFASDHWMKTPGVHRGPWIPEFCSPAEYFDILLAISREFDAGPRPGPFGFHMDGRRFISQLERWVPRASDGSLEGYQRRLDAMLEGRSLTITANHFAMRSFDVWRRFAVFSRQLAKLAGWPSLEVNVDTFYGRYDHTPDGIHRDSASVLTYVVTGKKTMLAWPTDAFDHRHPHDGNPMFLGHANTGLAATAPKKLVGEPGDLLHWSYAHWHMATEQTSWTAGLNLSFYVNRDPMLPLREALAEPEMVEALLPHRLTLEDCIHDDALPSGDVASPWLDAFVALGKQLAEPAAQRALQTALISRWLVRTSSGGFASVPAMASIETLPDERSVVRGDAELPVGLVHVDGDRALLGANGHVIEAPRSLGLQRFVEFARSGTDSSMGEVVAMVADGRSDDGLARQLVLELLRSRAIRHADSFGHRKFT